MKADNDTWEDVVSRQIYKSVADDLFPTDSKTYRRHINEFWANQLLVLEHFVLAAVKSKEVPFVPTLGGPKNVMQLHGSDLANQYFKLMPDFLQVKHMLSDAFDYNALVQTFIVGCEAVGLDLTTDWGNALGRPNPLHPIPTLNGLAAGEAFTQLVCHMRSTWRNGAGALYSNRCWDVKKRQEEYCGYADALFRTCSRQLVIRVDLNYSKQARDAITPQTAIHDLNHLVTNMAHNKIFSDLNGYMAKLEYGIEKGLHWHALFFFNGSVRNASARHHLVNECGDYWKTVITKGRGDYWNCHVEESSYWRLGRLGIGEINADQLGLRENLNRYVISYLCKGDQYLRPKGSGSLRLIRRGQVPEEKPIKPGRPRTRTPNSDPMDVRRKKPARPKSLSASMR